MTAVTRCSAADNLLRHRHEAPAAGLIRCQTRDRFFGGYALLDIHKPRGVADYELDRALPAELASRFSPVEDIEAERSEGLGVVAEEGPDEMPDERKEP